MDDFKSVDYMMDDERKVRGSGYVSVEKVLPMLFSPFKVTPLKVTVKIIAKYRSGPSMGRYAQSGYCKTSTSKNYGFNERGLIETGVKKAARELDERIDFICYSEIYSNVMWSIITGGNAHKGVNAERFISPPDYD